MTRPPKMTDAEIQASLADFSGWQVRNNALVKTFSFDDFAGAMAFVNRLAQAAEATDHHPDIDIRYSRVTVRLSTHDAGGITSLDFAGARHADEAMTKR